MLQLQLQPYHSMVTLGAYQVQAVQTVIKLLVERCLAQGVDADVIVARVKWTIKMMLEAMPRIGFAVNGRKKAAGLGSGVSLHLLLPGILTTAKEAFVGRVAGTLMIFR